MARQNAEPKWNEIGVGMAVTEPGSARENRTGDWRSQRPIWNHKACIKCGVCEVFCPEGCLKPNASGYPEVDLNYCKGCGVCERECWTSCIHMVSEEQ